MDIQTIVKQYNDGQSLAQLAREYNISTSKIKEILLWEHVKIRSQAEQNFYSNQQRRYKSDDTYFDQIDTCEKAWILGFLMADGTVSKKNHSIKIALSSIDREILEKIQREIQIERRILDTTTNNGYDVSELEWSNLNHRIQLAKYGIVPRKTYKENHLPEFNSKELIYAFILGYYDGDGCFKDDGTTCRWEICSYNPSILEDIANFINTQYNSDNKVYKDPSRNNYYTITYSTKIVVPFLNDAYKYCDLYLQRKYNKFNNWKIRNKRI